MITLLFLLLLERGNIPQVSNDIQLLATVLCIISDGIWVLAVQGFFKWVR